MLFCAEDQRSDVPPVTRLLVLGTDAAPPSAGRLRAAGVTAYLTGPLDLGGFFAHLAAPESRPPVPAALTRSWP